MITAATRTGLSGAELEQLRAMLEEQQDFRIEQLAALARPGAPGPLGSADTEISASLAAGARAALQDVRAALLRMADGSYGLCTLCGTSLGRERLEILPQAAMCMGCQRGTATAPAARDAGRGAGVAVTAAGNGHAGGR